jgi:hypothetical protein
MCVQASDGQSSATTGDVHAMLTAAGNNVKRNADIAGQLVLTNAQLRGFVYFDALFDFYNLPYFRTTASDANVQTTNAFKRHSVD